MKIILLILIFFSLQSCVIYNSTKYQDSNLCELHNEEMKKGLVAAFYGKGCFNGNTVAYPNAKAPKCMGCIRKIWPNRRLAIVYVCKSCGKAKKLYQNNNAQ